MFNETDLRDLLELKSQEPALSLYLNTEPSMGNADAYRLRLRTLLKSVELIEDKRAVESYFDHKYDWSGRSVAVFSCSKQNFFRAYPLALPIHDQVIVSDRASINPLAKMMENYGGYAVILVDKQGTRLFHFHMGELMEQEGWFGEQVKHTKRGGASSFPGRRGGLAGRTDHAVELVERNMREIVQFAVSFFEEKHIRRILICGTDENVAQLRGMLPKAWQSLIIGTFSMGMNASHSEVLEHTLEIGRQVEQRREARLVEDLITQSSKNGPAVTGLEKTLDAALQGRVQLLMVREGFQYAGSYCKTCNRLLLHESGICPTCNGEVQGVGDVVEFAVNSTLYQKGDVEFVHSNAEFGKAGDMGAFLRY